jgi:hypothetical protein
MWKDYNNPFPTRNPYNNISRDHEWSKIPTQPTKKNQFNNIYHLLTFQLNDPDDPEEATQFAAKLSKSNGSLIQTCTNIQTGETQLIAWINLHTPTPPEIIKQLAMLTLKNTNLTSVIPLTYQQVPAAIKIHP